MKKLLTTDEAAEIMTIAPKTVRALCHSGKIPSAKIGKGYRIKEEDLQEYIDSQSTKQ